MALPIPQSLEKKEEKKMPLFRACPYLITSKLETHVDANDCQCLIFNWYPVLRLFICKVTFETGIFFQVLLFAIFFFNPSFFHDLPVSYLEIFEDSIWIYFSVY